MFRIPLILAVFLALTCTAIAAADDPADRSMLRPSRAPHRPPSSVAPTRRPHTPRRSRRPHRQTARRDPGERE